MKRLLLLTAIFLTACGPSQEEKEEIAIISCNIMSESRNMDGAVRIKEINAAREKMGEDAFLGLDDAIKQSFEYGLCRELVLNDPDYIDKLTATLEIEFTRLKAEKEEREKRAKAARIEREKQAKAARIEREKREEAKRIQIEQAPSKYRKAVLKQIADYNPAITHAGMLSIGWGEIHITCLNGLFAEVIIKLTNGSELTQTIIDDGIARSTCDSNDQEGLTGYPGNQKGLYRLTIDKEDLKGHWLSIDSIKSAEIVVKGFYKPKDRAVNKDLSHPHLDGNHEIDPEIIIPISLDLAIAKQKESEERQKKGKADELAIHQDYLAASNKLLKDRDIEAAAISLKAHLDRHPDSPFVANAHYWLGEIYLMQGENELARQAFTTLTEEYANHPKFYDSSFKLGKIYFQLGELERAKSLIEIASGSSGVEGGHARSFLYENF